MKQTNILWNINLIKVLNKNAKWCKNFKKESIQSKIVVWRWLYQLTKVVFFQYMMNHYSRRWVRLKGKLLVNYQHFLAVLVNQIKTSQKSGLGLSLSYINSLVTKAKHTCILLLIAAFIYFTFEIKHTLTVS